MTTPIFFEDEAGEWRAQLKSANGEIVHTSEGYRDQHDAERGLGDLYATVDAVRGIDRMRFLLAELVEDSECRFDHHGGCQEHGFLSLEQGEKCPNHEALELLRETGERHG